MCKTGIPYWAAVPIAGAICLGAGFLFALPALRLEGLYLALATLPLPWRLPRFSNSRASIIGPAASRRQN
jgi:branched-chain amino acid transport system permease protein